MEQTISCCGLECSACEAFPGRCPGCATVKGAPYWTADIPGMDTCPLFACCVSEHGHRHCGQCPQLPCGRYELRDPSLSDEQHAAELLRRMERLHGLEDSIPIA